MRATMALMLLGAGGACAPAARPATIQADPGSVFTLRVGQEARLRDSLRIRFLGVTADSRCAIGTQCVWAGDAQLRLLVSEPGAASREVELHTTADPRLATAGPYTVSVQGLLPEPRANRAIDPAQYELDLLVTRG